jgi:hypothetical protein
MSASRRKITPTTCNPAHTPASRLSQLLASGGSGGKLDGVSNAPLWRGLLAVAGGWYGRRKRDALLTVDLSCQETTTAPYPTPASGLV